jgi:hypothetical protein
MTVEVGVKVAVEVVVEVAVEVELGVAVGVAVEFEIAVEHAAGVADAVARVGARSSHPIAENDSATKPLMSVTRFIVILLRAPSSAHAPHHRNRRSTA